MLAEIDEYDDAFYLGGAGLTVGAKSDVPPIEGSEGW